MVYVIDKAGNIAYKSTWTVAEELDTVLTELTDQQLVLAETGTASERL